MAEMNQLLINFDVFKKECKNALEDFEMKINDLEQLNTNKKQYTYSSYRMEINLEHKIKKELDIIEKTKTNIEKLLQKYSPLGDEKTLYNKYKESLNGKYNRFRLIKKNLLGKIDEYKLTNLLKTGGVDLSNRSSLNLLNSENNSLQKCIQIGNEIKLTGSSIEENLEEQEKILRRNDDKILTIINKVPVINKVLSSINYHKYKQSIILGLVVGIIIMIGLYLTFY